MSCSDGSFHGIGTPPASEAAVGGRIPMSGRFCEMCCTPHLAEALCPGELRATGPELPAWEVTVETPRGLEQIAVLLAPSRELWRARITTRPRTLWLVPGGASTLKFAGPSREQALHQAVAFIDQHCVRRGYSRRNRMLPVEQAHPAGVRTPRSKAAIPHHRKRCRLALRWGLTRPSVQASTDNLSVQGMFVATRRPADPGAAVRINLDLAGTTAQLDGLVMWTRSKPERGKPSGMGLRLVHPPPAYADFVVALPL
jgi:hypothetical protein